MVWYEQWFNRDEYEIVYQNRNEAEATALVDLVERIAEPVSGDHLLDIGCGRGRHAMEFSTRGYTVTGLDLSERAIEQARIRSAEAGLSITFIQGDMRDPVADSKFEGVLNLFTAFGYFEEWDDHQKAVDAMAGAVRPEGFVVQDFLNAPYVVSGLVSNDERIVGDVKIEQRRWIEEGRIMKEIIFTRGETTHSFFESVALLRKPDFEKLYRAAGLELFEIRGDYEGAPHSDSSPRMILFSRRIG